MRLLKIASNAENCIDECLMFCPVDYVEMRVLEIAEDYGVENPEIVLVLEISSRFDRDVDYYRPYVG